MSGVKRNTRLEPPEHAVLWPGIDADQVHQVHHHQEDPEHAANHHQPPRHLVRALVLLAHRALFRMGMDAQRDKAGGEAQADDPVE